MLNLAISTQAFLFFHVFAYFVHMRHDRTVFYTDHDSVLCRYLELRKICCTIAKLASVILIAEVSSFCAQDFLVFMDSLRHFASLVALKACP